MAILDQRQNLERFGDLVLADPKLHDQLRAAANETAFVALAVRLGAERGCEFSAPLVFAHGNPRVAVGSMNGMKRELPLNTNREGFKQVDDEDWINGAVFLSLPETNLRKAFAQRLAGANAQEL